MDQKSTLQVSRRKFLKASSLFTAGFFIVPRHVLGGDGYTAPSDMINLGFIGCGRQSRGLGPRFLKQEGARMAAACDVDITKLERFKGLVAKHHAEAKDSASSPKDFTGYRDFRELIAQEDLDAVIVATPDHWHSLISIAAMKSGKDVYCEKPLALTVKESKAMVKAARKYDRVVQTGSMQRSRDNFRKACELVRNGYIGEIKEVKVSIGGPPKVCDLPKQEPKRDIMWNMWVGPATFHDYHDDLAPPIPEAFWPRWRYYREFGGGMVTDWGAHMFDIAQWGLGMDHSGPVAFIPADGEEYKFMTLEYANGVKMVHEKLDRGNQVRFIGSEGTIDISRGFFESTPASLITHKLKDSDIHLYNSQNHEKDFLDAVRNRTRPICDVEIGHRTASVCNLTNITYELNRKLQWDPVKEKFVGDKEANKKLSRKMRKDWKNT